MGRRLDLVIKVSLDWKLASETAKRILGPGFKLSEEEKNVLKEKYIRSIEKVDSDISNFTGLKIDKSLDKILIMDSYDWIDKTIESYKQIFENNIKGMALSWQDRRILSELIGQQLAYMSIKVLGQYDSCFFGNDKIGQMYFLHQNIERTALELRVGLDDFIDWIALHEHTHQYEFNSNTSSWLREYINKKVQESIEKDVRNRRFSLFNRHDNFNTLAKSDIQAVMCLMEGFSDYVMNELSPKFVFSHSQIKEKLSEKRRNGEIDALQFKKQQYLIGEKFVREVVNEKGMDFLRKAFESAENLPNYQEIMEPKKWVVRIETMKNT